MGNDSSKENREAIKEVADAIHELRDYLKSVTERVETLEVGDYMHDHVKLMNHIPHERLKRQYGEELRGSFQICSLASIARLLTVKDSYNEKIKIRRPSDFSKLFTLVSKLSSEVKQWIEELNFQDERIKDKSFGQMKQQLSVFKSFTTDAQKDEFMWSDSILVIDAICLQAISKYNILLKKEYKSHNVIDLDVRGETKFINDRVELLIGEIKLNIDRHDDAIDQLKLLEGVLMLAASILGINLKLIKVMFIPSEYYTFGVGNTSLKEAIESKEGIEIRILHEY